jgi:parvulin-like peptidyl-prolyl isomerase
VRHVASIALRDLVAIGVVRGKRARGTLPAMVRERLAILVLGAVTIAPSVHAQAAPRITAGVVDRIVAVVANDVILLSELGVRARVFEKSVTAASTPGTSRPAVEALVKKEVLSRMIDERLIAAEAERMQLVVSADEIEAAVRDIASTQSMSPSALFAAARAAGMSAQAYRQELGRQLLEAKMVQLRVVPRIKGFAKLPEAARTTRLDEERRAWLEELRRATFVEVRL